MSLSCHNYSMHHLTLQTIKYAFKFNCSSALKTFKYLWFFLEAGQLSVVKHHQEAGSREDTHNFSKIPISAHGMHNCTELCAKFPYNGNVLVLPSKFRRAREM